MGTNFYLGKYVYETKYENHIGKRSAAGLYCWDCDETLIIGGKDMFAMFCDVLRRKRLVA